MKETTNKRSLDVKKDGVEIPAEVKALMKEHYFANKEANEAKKKADKARAQLYKLMGQTNITHYECKAQSDGGMITLEADVKPGRSTTVINVESLLRETADTDTFLKMVGASVKSVEEVAGKAMVDKVGTVTAGRENVHVKVKK